MTFFQLHQSLLDDAQQGHRPAERHPSPSAALFFDVSGLTSRGTPPTPRAVNDNRTVDGDEPLNHVVNG